MRKQTGTDEFDTDRLQLKAANSGQPPSPGKESSSLRYEPSLTFLSMSSRRSCELCWLIQTVNQQRNHQVKEHEYLEAVGTHHIKIHCLRKMSLGFFCLNTKPI